MEFVRRARDSLRQSKDKFGRNEFASTEIKNNFAPRASMKKFNLSIVDSFVNLSTLPRCGLLRRGRLRRCLWYAVLLRLLLRLVHCLRRRVVGWRPTAVATEQRERRQAPVERQNQTAPVDLSDLPSADIVADLHAGDLRRSRTNDGARAFAVYHDTENSHIRRRKRRRCLGNALDRRRRRSRRMAARRKQRTIARRRQTIQRWLMQGIGGNAGGLVLGLRVRTGREHRSGPEHRERGDRSSQRMRHGVPRRQKARSASVVRKSGSSTGRPAAAPAGCTANASTTI